MRLYRFSDLIGNRTAVSLLQRSLVNKTLKNFIILSGMMGTGKSTSAEIVGLYLTCEQPKDGEPCLSCDSCKTNLKALQTTGVSTNLVKKNLGLVGSKKDVNELIKEIFVLQGTFGNNVYILEEAHALSSNDQIPLLEEMDRLDDNTYVIICTTKPHRLIPELRSRAITYSFNRLGKTDMKLLFDRTVAKLGIKKISTEVESMILKYARGIPRDAVNMIDFVYKNYPSEEELREFLGFISNEAFLELFESMKSSIRDMALSVEDLLKSNPLDTIISQMKEFMVNAIFAIEGGSTEEFSKKELEYLKSIFDEKTCYKVASIIDKFDGYNFSEADFKLSLIKLRQAMVGKPTTSILTENVRESSAQTVKAAEKFNQEEMLRNEASEGKLTKLTAFGLKELAKEMLNKDKE